MLLNIKVFVVPNSKTVKYYKEKGYDAKVGIPIQVYQNDLTNGSWVEVKVKCDICNKEFSRKYSKYIKSNKKYGYDTCNNCKTFKIAEALKISEEDFDKRLFESNNTIVRKESYKNIDYKILFKCKVCNNEWYTYPYFLIKNNPCGCPKCSYTNNGLKRVKDHNTFINEVNILGNNEYQVLSKYERSNKKILIEHTVCGTKYKVMPNKFLQGRRCPVCSESKGEQKIRLWLTTNNYNFDSQESFNNLLGNNNGLLRFDFVVYDENKNINCLIEFDGEQHYKWIEGMMTKKQFETLKIHDRRKNKYCKSNNINLLRIPYWDFDNIEEILNKKIGGN